MTPPLLTRLGLESGKLLVVGVSGGPDSLALLHYLHSWGEAMPRPYPLIVASFNHRLRPEAEADVAFVRDFAAKLGLPFVTDSADVSAYAEAAGLSVEEAARELRYRFLFRTAREAGAQAVAVGHTADDQAETVLMHFLRGAGISGLKGMPPRIILPIFDPEIPLVRPLLDWTRAETEAYCRKHNLQPRLDQSNSDTAYFRNRLRHELLPELEKYNPQIRSALTKTALALQGDAELLAEMIEAAWNKTVSATGSGFVALELAQLQNLSPAMQRNLFRKAAFSLKPALRNLDFDALERAATLTASELAGGLRTVIEMGTLYVTGDAAELPINYPQISDQFSVSSDQSEFGNGWALTRKTLDPEHCSLITDPWSACFDADLTENRLRVRPVRSGDRFEQLGMPHQTVKIADLFVNLKIPKRLRKNWPLVSVEETIAWVPGLRMGEKFKVTEKTRQVIKIEIKRLP